MSRQGRTLSRQNVYVRRNPRALHFINVLALQSVNQMKQKFPCLTGFSLCTLVVLRIRHSVLLATSPVLLLFFPLSQDPARSSQWICRPKRPNHRSGGHRNLFPPASPGERVETADTPEHHKGLGLGPWNHCPRWTGQPGAITAPQYGVRYYGSSNTMVHTGGESD